MHRNFYTTESAVLVLNDKATSVFMMMKIEEDYFVVVVDCDRWFSTSYRVVFVAK